METQEVVQSKLVNTLVEFMNSDQTFTLLPRTNTSPWIKDNRINRYDHTFLSLGPSVDSQGRPVTGIHDNSQREQKEVKGQKVFYYPLQDKFEELLGFKTGELSNSPDNPFWRNFAVKVPVKGLELNPSIPEQALQILFANRSKLVTKAGEFPTPKAAFVLFNEELEAKAQNKTREIKFEAIKIYDTMTKADKIDFLIATSSSTTVETLGDDVIDNRVGSIVESKPKFFHDIVKSASYKDRLMLNYLFNKGVINSQDGRYMYGEKTLGLKMEEVIGNINLPQAEWQRTRLALVEAYNQYRENKIEYTPRIIDEANVPAYVPPAVNAEAIKKEIMDSVKAELSSFGSGMMGQIKELLNESKGPLEQVQESEKGKEEKKEVKQESKQEAKKE